MKIQNGIVQRDRNEVPESWVTDNLWIQGPDGFWYYNNPFNQTPWLSFYGKPKIAPGVPVDFIKIFGPRPDGVAELNFWEQQLALFARIATPFDVSEAAIDNAEFLCDHYGVGVPISWQTIRGDFIVTPTGVKELFNTEDFESTNFYNRPLHAITLLQVSLLNKGVRPKNLSPFLENLKIQHQG